jgi:hypothetical protein
MKKLLILAAFVTSAHAEFVDGNRLLADLKSPDAFERGIAMGYILGIADRGRSVTNCMPANVTAGQLQDMVRQHLESFPSGRHYTGDVIVSFVLGQAWPCKKGASL